jgi:ATP-dependent Clp protease protease subunit
MLKPFPMKVRNEADKKTGEVLIYEPIGADFFGEGLDAKAFAQQVKSLGDLDELDVRINSPGGSVWDGMAIYNTLASHKAKVNVYVDGIAASAASFIAMAASPGCLCMAENAIMMIHCAQGFTVGNATDHDKTAEILREHDGIIAQTYARRTGRKQDTMLRMMQDETWMNADFAKDNGFCDTVTPAKKMAACCDPKALAARFPKMPSDVAARLAELDKVEQPTAAADGPTSPPENGEGGDQASPAHSAEAVQVRLRLLDLEDATAA